MGFPAKQPNYITAWSFSRWNTWRKCPRKAYYKFVKRLKEESGPAAERGSMIDEAAEQVLLSRRWPTTTIPELSGVKKLLAKLHKLHATPQMEIGLTSAWKPAEGRPNSKNGVGAWFGSQVWCRIKIDAIAFKGKLAGVTDWKSGKYKPGSESYELQLDLYGTGVFAAFPKVEEVETRLVFTDHKGQGPIKVYTRDQFESMKEAWNERVKPMLADRRFAPLPSYACNYCSFSKSKGGDCKY